MKTKFRKLESRKPQRTVGNVEGANLRVKVETNSTAANDILKMFSEGTIAQVTM